MANVELAKRRQERIARRQFLTDRFLTHFVFGIIYSAYVIGFEMATVSAHTAFAEAFRFWTFWGGLAAALILAILPVFIKKMRRGWWWRTAVYFLAFLGTLHAVITLWVVFMIGNDWNALVWSHAFIWAGVVVSFVVYLILYNKIGKEKEGKNVTHHTKR